MGGSGPAHRCGAAILVGILLWGWFPSAVAAASPERVLTLDEAVTLAFNNNHELLSAKEDLTVSQQRVKEAQALFFPKLDLYSGYSRFEIRNPFLLSPGLGPATLQPQPTFETENFFQARASLYQTLYSGGRSRNTYRLAKLSQEQAHSQYDAKRNVVIHQAKKAFYDVLLEQERSQRYAQSWQAVERFMGHPRAKGGNAVERLRREGEIELLRNDVTRAAAALARRRLEFLRTLALEQHTGVELQGEFLRALSPMDLQKCLAWAKQYRPELRHTQFQAQIDALGVSLSLAERFPTVAFGSSYEFSGERFPLNSPNWAATVYINLPLSISDLYFGWSRVREQRAHYRQTRVQRAALEDTIELEIRQAFSDVHSWHGEAAPREAAVQRMEALQQILHRQFQEGTATLTDMVHGERLVLETRLRAVQARYEQTVAVVTLEQAMGRSLQGE